MADIEEIPISAQDIPETMQEIPQDIPEKQTISEDIPKKGRGRPAGAKNKPKPAPKPKPKPKAKKPVEYDEYDDEDSEEEEAPPPRRRGRQVSGIQPPHEVEFDRHALAADVLGILQQQRYQRTTARRSHYASCFENIQ